VQLGPVTLSELQRLARTGTLAPTDRVWKQGLAQWVAVAQVPALRAGAGTSGIEPPPLLLSAATAEDELRLAPAPDARHATQAVRRWGNVQPPPAIGLHKRRPKRSRTLRRTSSVVPAIIVVLLLAVLGGIGVFAVTRSSDAGSAGGGGTRVTFRVSGPPQSAIVMHRPGQARGSAGVFIEVPWEKTAVLDTPDSANVIMLVRNASMVTAEVEVNGRVWKSLASPNTLGGGYLIQGVIER